MPTLRLFFNILIAAGLIELEALLLFLHSLGVVL